MFKNITPLRLAKTVFRRARWIALCFMALPLSILAQISVTCPSNMVIVNDSGVCGAIGNYGLVITGGGLVNVPFSYTGAVQTWTVPNGVGSVILEAYGAQGNSNGLGVAGGLGGYATGTLSVTPGEVLNIYGGGGATMSTVGGFNGGGNAGAVGSPSAFGGGGGGASDVRVGGTALSNRVIVGGGGGGAGGNRVAGLGRGTGGGGGGGFYGGGGGAGWPYTSVIVPTGGTQASGGIGGVSDWTSVPNNDGFPGSLGFGGNGGDEAVSSQSSSQTGSVGGVGGGLLGANGTYAGNFAGQSGAGGSSYIGGVTSGSTSSGMRTGNGMVVVSYQVVDTIYAISGMMSGGFFPAGTTTNTLVVTHGLNSDSCSFTLTVNDTEAPTFVCPALDTIWMDSSCVGRVPDHTASISATDNCTLLPTESQSPIAGTTLTSLGSMHSVAFTATDSAGNIDSCSFMAILWDNTAPSMTCPSTFQFTSSSFDCNPSVNFPAATAFDNCGSANLTSTHSPGDNFTVGSWPVTYYGSDSLGNMDSCTFLVVVHNPQVNGYITVSPNVVCVGDTFTFTAAPGFTYLWSTGSTANSTTTTSAGVLWVDLTDSLGCTARDSITVPAFTQPLPVVTPNGASLCTGNFVSYQWYLNGTAISGATGQCFQPLVDGSFSVMVVDSFGCEGESDTMTFVGMVDNHVEIGFDLFPNPASNVVNLIVHQPIFQEVTLTMYDLAGRVVMHKTYDGIQKIVQLDLGLLSAGSYFVRITDDTFSGQRRLIHLE